VTIYNERLSWLNRQDKGTLLGMARKASPHSRMEASASISTDALKGLILAWAEGPGRAEFEAFRRAVDAVTGNGAEDEEEPCR
jgi:hypothetical protein